MGISSRLIVHARDRDGPDRRNDPGQTAARRVWQSGWLCACLIASLLWSAAGQAQSLRPEFLRIATYNLDLTRKGPGLVLRDILRGKDKQINGLVQVIADLDADVVLLTSLDYDYDLVTLGAFADLLQGAGAAYPHRFATRPNRGWATGLDLNGDGQAGGADDAQGWGHYAGEGGMAVLSRLPIDVGAVRDFSGFLWRDLPGALTGPNGIHPEQRLSTTAHWEVPVILPDGVTLRLLAWHATPPVFDGPDDRNGRRNHDEAAFWLRLLAGDLPFAPPAPPFVLLGTANLDPNDGDGLPDAIRALLAHPKLQDVAPRASPGHTDPGHSGDDTLDTAVFDRTGGLRVDYILPSADLEVVASGLLTPVSPEASRHVPVWVDIMVP